MIYGRSIPASAASSSRRAGNDYSNVWLDYSEPITMKDNTVSVIITCYNGGVFLGEALESVLSQSYQQFEIIVVDDGSSDNTRTVAACYPNVNYIYQDNQGVSAARNKGIAESKGIYLVFLDHDDILLPNTLELGVNYLDTHPACGLVYGYVTVIGADGQPKQQKPRQHLSEAASYKTMLEGKGLVPSGAAMFRRSVVESFAGFSCSKTFSQDYDLYLEISRNFPIYCHNQVVLEYRRHGENTTARMGVKRTLERTLRSLERQRPYVMSNLEYKAAYQQGKETWLNKLGPALVYEMASNLKRGQFTKAAQVLLFMLKHYPQGFLYAGELLSKLTSPVLSSSRLAKRTSRHENCE